MADTLSASTLLPVTTRRAPTERRAPVLTVLAHPDVDRVGQRAWLDGEAPAEGFPLSRAEPMFAGAPLGDRFISRAPIRVLTAGALGLTVSARATRTELRVDGVLTEGALTVSPERIADGVVLELAGRVALLLHTRAVADEPGPNLGMIGVSEAVERLRRQIVQVADLNVPVLVRGESGVGKERVAQALHSVGPRRDAPCVALNLAAVPPTLAASELFGHARGAFSGANADHEGCFARADGGTLFLDEVGDAPYDVQAMLLRVLETGEVTPVGGRSARTVDVRVVAATDADLEGAIEAGRFRAALLHRLAGFRIEVPPLRRRRDDVGVLFHHFARAEAKAMGEDHRFEQETPWMPAALVARLARHDWPGNVRELRNVARQLVVLNRDRAVMDASAALDGLLGPTKAPPPTTVEKPTYRAAGEVDEDELVAALKAHGYRLKPAAAALGISRTALYGLIERTDRVRKAADLSAADIEAAAAADPDPDAMAARLAVSRHALLMRMRQLGLR